MRFRAVFLLVVLLSVVFLAGCSSGEAGESTVGVEEGDTAPDFELSGFQLEVLGEGEYTYKDINDMRLSDFRGKVVFLNFWGTWCPPCRREMPQMEEMYRDYRNFDFVILAIEVNQREGIDAVRPFIESYELTFPILLDQGRTGDLYKIRAFPTTLIIDPEGIIRERIQGAPYDWSSVRWRTELIEPLLPVQLP